MLYILLAVLFFGFLIAIHEFGHFLTAKVSGVKVNEFSIGMGPQILKKQGRETVYSLRLFPIGGFCAMEGEDIDTDDIHSFAKASAWRKFLILIAGSAANFLTGLLILMCLFSAAKSTTTAVIDSFADGCPAYTDGYLQPGDEIIRIDGHRVLIYSDILTLFSRGNGETVDLTIKRGDDTLYLEQVPMAKTDYTENGVTTQRYGINFSVRSTMLFENFCTAIRTSIDFVRMVWFGLEDLISGAAGLKDLSGPIGVVDSMNQVGKASATVGTAVLNLLYFGAFIAINLSVMNLLPLPALDGGRIFFLLLNLVLMKIVHKEIPAQYEGYVHFTGMILLLLLMFVVGINDVLKLIN